MNFGLFWALQTLSSHRKKAAAMKRKMESSEPWGSSPTPPAPQKPNRSLGGGDAGGVPGIWGGIWGVRSHPSGGGRGWEWKGPEAEGDVEDKDTPKPFRDTPRSLRVPPRDTARPLKNTRRPPETPQRILRDLSETPPETPDPKTKPQDPSANL